MSAATRVPVGQWEAALSCHVEICLTSAQEIPVVMVGKTPATLNWWLLSHCRKM